MPAAKRIATLPSATKTSLLTWALLHLLACNLTWAEAQTFPLMGEARAFTGQTRHTAPEEPGAFQIAAPANWYYEWPTPKPLYSYTTLKNRKKVGHNQEPGFYACRPSVELPQGCGRPHQGVDIYAYYGTPIVAPENGTIISYKGADVFALPGSESKNGGAGRLFRLRGNSGYVYTFAHTMGFSEAVAARAGVAKDFAETEESALNVPVKAGEIVSYVGRTGGVSNPHLHLQISREERDVDPARVIGR
jgi:murein DD-endopeptidase MepM/ murein hydrolase activator NlpD